MDEVTKTENTVNFSFKKTNNSSKKTNKEEDLEKQDLRWFFSGKHIDSVEIREDFFKLVKIEVQHKKNVM